MLIAASVALPEPNIRDRDRGSEGAAGWEAPPGSRAGTSLGVEPPGTN